MIAIDYYFEGGGIITMNTVCNHMDLVVSMNVFRCDDWSLNPSWGSKISTLKVLLAVIDYFYVPWMYLTNCSTINLFPVR